jgi:hypothetical protein
VQDEYDYYDDENENYTDFDEWKYNNEEFCERCGRRLKVAYEDYPIGDISFRKRMFICPRCE